MTFVLSNPSSLQDRFPSFPLLLPVIPISALGIAARRLLSLDVAILPSNKNQTLITRALKARHPGLLKRFSTSGSACEAAEEPQARAQGSPGNQSPRFPPQAAQPPGQAPDGNAENQNAGARSAGCHPSHRGWNGGSATCPPAFGRAFVPAPRRMSGGSARARALP